MDTKKQDMTEKLFLSLLTLTTDTTKRKPKGWEGMTLNLDVLSTGLAGGPQPTGLGGGQLWRLPPIGTEIPTQEGLCPLHRDLFSGSQVKLRKALLNAEEAGQGRTIPG